MTRPGKAALLIFYDYFYPAYKAGGPIQSLTNLILLLKNEYDISVVTSAYDLNEKSKLENVETDKWSDVILPGAGEAVKIWYAGAGRLNRSVMQKLLEELNPEIVYLNGMFSYRYVLLPLLSVKKAEIVICPRGMLQRGALAGKSIKKKIYLSALKFMGLAKKVTWHATNDEESNDIKRIFGNGVRVIITGNIPKQPVNTITYPGKMQNRLRLVYLSLISSKKNLLQAIEIVNNSTEKITLDIYGPVKDIKYWESCKQLIKASDGKVVYKGEVQPEKVQSVFSGYDAAVFLTKGENFGHALYESFSAGRPIITSYFTPWNDLEIKKAGWNVDISNQTAIMQLFKSITEMDTVSFNEYCDGAYSIAREYYNNKCGIDEYKQLFGTRLSGNS